MAADYPTGEWYRKYISSYEDRVMKEFQKQIMKGTTEADNLDYKKHYDNMLESGMFFEWNPDMCGLWEADMVKWIEKYGNGVEEEELVVKEPMPEYYQELQNIQLKLQEIIDALRNAIEKGNDLHLGIVVGQTLKQLEDIAYK
jgi:hypothetical protein